MHRGPVCKRQSRAKNSTLPLLPEEANFTSEQRERLHKRPQVGRNETKVKILKPMAGGNAFMVKSLSSGKEFIVPGSRLNVPTVSIERIEPKPVAPTKKMSLMDAAVAVLKESGEPMNTREMVKAAAEKGYWTPTACKTPEQPLCGSIFREIKTKVQPRIVKSDIKGKSRLD